ncbi:hypothetical protein BX600DRAFT_63112 [Xylariales sp. PMI_506]|nr:hypothetical protein BX600DRAFT_63112 [Xylariales sp. PMI_506]
MFAANIFAMALPALVAAEFNAIPAPALRPRQGRFTATLDPCFASVTSVFASNPTPPPELLSWESSALATASCGGVQQPTGSVLSLAEEWSSSLKVWSSEHVQDLVSLTSECGPYLRSVAAEEASSLEASLSACKSRESAGATQTAAGTGPPSHTLGPGGPPPPPPPPPPTTTYPSGSNSSGPSLPSSNSSSYPTSPVVVTAGAVTANRGFISAGAAFLFTAAFLVLVN